MLRQLNEQQHQELLPCWPHWYYNEAPCLIQQEF